MGVCRILTALWSNWSRKYVQRPLALVQADYFNFFVYCVSFVKFNNYFHKPVMHL